MLELKTAYTLFISIDCDRRWRKAQVTGCWLRPSEAPDSLGAICGRNSDSSKTGSNLVIKSVVIFGRMATQ